MLIDYDRSVNWSPTSVHRRDGSYSAIRRCRLNVRFARKRTRGKRASPAISEHPPQRPIATLHLVRIAARTDGLPLEISSLATRRVCRNPAIQHAFEQFHVAVLFKAGHDACDAGAVGFGHGGRQVNAGSAEDATRGLRSLTIASAARNKYNSTKFQAEARRGRPGGRQRHMVPPGFLKPLGES